MINYSKLKSPLYTIFGLFFIVCFIFISVYYSFEKPIWRDEAFSYLLSQQPLVSIIKSTALDYNPPLFYIVLHYFQKLIGPSAVCQRMLPLLFSILTIVVVYLSSSILYSKNKPKLLQILTLTFLVTNGSLLYYSYELRPYSMMMLLGYLVFFLSIQFKRNSTKKYAISLVLCSVALLYTQTLGVVWLGLVAFGVSFVLVIEKKWLILGKYITVMVISLTGYIPWIYVVLSQVQNFSSSFWLEFIPEEKLQNLSALFAYNEGPLHLPIELYERIYLALYRLAIVVFVISFLKNNISRLLAILIATFLSVLWYVSYRTPLFYGRYFVFLSPLVSSLCAYAVYSLVTYMHKNSVYKAGALTVLGWILGVYGFATLNLWKDYKLGVARVDYHKIKNERVDTVYVTSDLDIMPCMVYQSSCYYVGSKDSIKSYTGVLQLQKQPILELWEQVQGNRIGLVHRQDRSEEAISSLHSSGYQVVSNEWIGEDAYFAVIER